MKKLLLIAYHFPPDSEVGGIRVAKFAKYLPEFGYEPYVLTIKEKNIRQKDEYRLKDVSEIKIFRAALWPNIMEILLMLRNLIFLRTVIKGSGSGSNTTDFYHPPEVNPPGPIRAGNTSGLAYHIKRFLDSILELPDKMIGWLIPAVWKGYWLIKKEGIEIVLTSSPPLTVGIIGLVLSKLTGVKLVTDLRDPLELHKRKHESRRTILSDTIEKWIEKKIMYGSGKIISTTIQYTELLRSCYPELPTDKFCTISNGFDSSDYNLSDTNNDESDSFILTYLGTFYHGRTPKEFLEAISQLCKENIIPIDKLKVNLIGDVCYAEGIPVEELIKKCNLNGCINISNKIPYKESLVQMRKAVVLLLFAPEQYYAIPAKAYEYLFAKRYILCFAKDGATADLIRKTKSGIVVDPYNVRVIKDAVKKLYLFWESRKKLTIDKDLLLYERRELTRRLSQILDA